MPARVRQFNPENFVLSGSSRVEARSENALPGTSTQENGIDSAVICDIQNL
jgi:hypothetical protein